MCYRKFDLNQELELDNDPGTFGGSSTNRKRTDVFALIIMVLFLVTVIALTIYCNVNSDVGKLLNGYDDSGNICGRNNFKTDSMPSDVVIENMEQKKYVFIKADGALGQTRECVENCTMRGTSLFSNYCIFDKNLVPYYIVMLHYWNFILLSLFWGAFSVLGLYCDSRNNWEKRNLHIWFWMGFLWGICTVARRVCYNYILFDVFLILIIIVIIDMALNYFTIFTPQITLKLSLAHQLHQEVWEALKSMTLFWLMPLMSTILIIVLIFSLIHGWIRMHSFSYPERIDVCGTKIDYFQYPIVTVTQALLIYVFFLMYEIVKNCQCMMVGGYVAQWYYTRRDGELSQPIRRTFRNLLKYHLGTICCASLILPIVYVVRVVVNAIKGASGGRNKETIQACSCHLITETCLTPFIPYLNTFSENGLILTAMYGCSFFAGSTRAHKLLYHSSFNIVKINTLRDANISFHKRTIWVACFFLYEVLVQILHFHNIKQEQIICIYYVILSSIIIYLGSSIIDIAIDTLYLCFCEDCLYNNDASKPFYTSPNFAQFIEDANKCVDPVKWKEVADKWGNGLKRLYL